MRAILQTAALAALLSAFGVHAQKLDPVQDLEQMARQFSGATVAGEQQSDFGQDYIEYTSQTF